jgi:hypothetical protein
VNRRPVVPRVLRLTLALALSSAVGCRCSRAELPMGPLTRTSDAGEDEVRPVYPPDDRPPEPLARELCAALYRLPAQRRALCCHRPEAETFSDQCARTLSSALRSGAVSIDPATVAACRAALETGHQGCDWVGPSAPALPAVCQGLLGGTRKAGDRCRSSLECGAALRCRGVGPTQEGRCDVPGQPRTPCGQAVDVLAVYLKQDLASAHPECAGACIRGTCIDGRPLGAACVFNGECGPGRHCGARQCVEGVWAVEGAACVPGACIPGTLCRAGACTRPGAPGTPCINDAECLGGCVIPDGGVEGRCAMRCGSG